MHCLIKQIRIFEGITRFQFTSKKIHSDGPLQFIRICTYYEVHKVHAKYSVLMAGPLLIMSCVQQLFLCDVISRKRNNIETFFVIFLPLK